MFFPSVPRVVLTVIVLPVCLLGLASGWATDGQPDPDFGDGGVAFFTIDGVEGHELATRAVLTLPEGKLLIGGSRNRQIPGNPDPHMRPTLVRLNADGSPDGGFGNSPNNPGLLILPSVSDTGMQSVEAMQRLDDGSILVAGTAFAFGPQTGFVMKLDPGGALDTGFGDGGIAVLADIGLHALGVDGRGRIVIAGERALGLDIVGVVVRLGVDGGLDSGFGPNADGMVVFEPMAADEYGYLHTLAIDGDDRIVVGGSYAGIAGADFSIARLDSTGAFDASFAEGGWRVFRIPGDDSSFNGIHRLLLTPERGIVFAAYRWDEQTGVGPLLGRLDADGATDPEFGDPTTPGYSIIEVAPEAANRYPSALLRQDDGKLLVSISYSNPFGSPARQQFMVLRVSADGVLDDSFGSGGIVALDLTPAGVYSDLTAMTLDQGRTILAGMAKRDPASPLVDLAVVRLRAGDDDVIFADGFERGANSGQLSTYDDLPEGFLGTSFTYEGVRYRDINGIGGVFPDGSTFEPDDVGNHLVIERGPAFYDDFPAWGSSPQALTFGNAYMPGDSLSIGPLVRATMDLDTVMHAVRFDLAYYENGPWGGIVLHLDAYRDGILVDTDHLTIADLDPDRDRVAVATLSIDGVAFDSLQLYATWQGQPSGPRVMIDNLLLTPVGER